MRADNVIVMAGDGDETQVDIQAPEAPEAPPLSIKIEHEDIPQDPEESVEPALRRSHTVIIQSLRGQKRVERVLTGLRRLWALELK